MYIRCNVRGGRGWGREIAISPWALLKEPEGEKEGVKGAAALKEEEGE